MSNKLSPFASKVHELSRNLRITAETFGRSMAVVEDLLGRCEDIPFLLEEVVGSEEDLHEATLRYYDAKAEAEAIMQMAKSCQERALALAQSLGSDKYFKAWLALPVQRHHEGIFSLDRLAAGRLARRVRDAYFRR